VPARDARVRALVEGDNPVHAEKMLIKGKQAQIKRVADASHLSILFQK